MGIMGSIEADGGGAPQAPATIPEHTAEKGGPPVCHPPRRPGSEVSRNLA
jgi:hypothetical protein